MHRSPAQRHRTWIFQLIAVAAALVWLLPAAPANAQGTMGTVPDPISSRDLEDYADRLGLSRQQRQAVEMMHDQYRDDFSRLRDTDIEKFLNDNRGMGGMGMLMDRDAAKKALKSLDDIQNKIKAVDNRLFDQMQTVLTEDQVAKMPQVRMTRERARYRSGLSRLTGYMNPASQVDLSELLVEFTLSPQEKQSIDPVMMQYESTLTSGSRKLYDSTSSMMLEALDKLQQQGLTQDNARDPQRRGEMFQSFRSVMGDIQRKLAAKAGELSDLNRRTLGNVATLLADDHAHSLRDLYNQRAYPEIGSGGGNTARAFDIALKLKDLSQDLHDTITVMASDYHASLDRIHDEMMDAIDANRKNQSFFDFDQEARRKFDEQMNALRDKRNKLNNTALASLKAALSPEQNALLDKRLGGAGDKQDGEAQITMTFTGAGGNGTFTTSAVIVSDAASDIAVDPFLPGPINARDVDDYVKRLKLAPEDAAILKSLHDDYMDKYKTIESEKINPVRQAQRKLWGMDGSGQVTPPSPKDIDELYSLRRTAFDAIHNLDEKFFDDMSVAVAGDEQTSIVKRLRGSRERQTYGNVNGGNSMMFARAGGPGGRGGPGGPRGGGPRGPRDANRGGGRNFRVLGGPFRFGGESNESSLDLASLVDALSLQPSDPSQYNAALVEYDQNATAVFQKMFESALRMQEARDKMMAQASADNANNDGRPRRAGGNDDARRLMDTQSQAAAQARNAVAALNKSTLNKLMSALPDSDARNLRHTYYEKAFPGVFRDPRSAEPHLDAAMKLPDLTDQQRTQIQEITLDFRNQYDQLNDKLVDLEAAMPDMGGPPQGRDWQSIQEQMRTREKIEFDRNDLSDKTLAKLRSALNEQQIQSLGGLQPETDENG